MKRFLLLLLPLMALTMWSCSSQDEPQIPEQVEETKSPAISQDEAISVAMNAMKSFGFITPSRSDVSASDLEITTHSSEKEDTAFYVVSYPEGGFVAVDANSEALAKVLAISDTGEMSEIGINYLRNSRPQKAAPGITIEPVLPITPGNISKVYKHFTPEWDEYAPFNSAFGRFPAGKETVAIGETLAYFKKSIQVDGKPFDWTSIDPFDPNEDDINKISKFLKQIAVDMQAKQGSGNSIVFDSIANRIKKYGYNNCSYFSFSTDVGFPNYFKDGPVLAHTTLPDEILTWVVDAIEYTQETLQLAVGVEGKPTTIIDMYLHMNWGLYGVGNGYFLTYYCDTSKYIDKTYDWEFEAWETEYLVMPQNTKFLSVK